MPNRPDRLRSRALTALLGVLLLGAAVGCSGPTGEMPVSDDPVWNGVLERAAVQGEVNLYHVAPPAQMNRVIDAFEQRYPQVQVSTTRGAADLTSRVTTEVQTGNDGADVFVFSDPAWYRTNAEALLPVEGPTSWPSDAWAVPGSAPSVSIVPFGMLLWNTEIFPEGFRDFEDLERPEVAGRLGTRSDGTTTVSAYFDFLEKHLGPDHLPALWRHDPKFYESTVPLAQAVASGEVGVANVSSPPVIEDLKSKNAPIESIVPNPGYSTAFVAAALRKTPRPDAARLFVDFMLSPEGQHAMNGDGFSGSPVPVSGAIDVSEQTVFDSADYPPEEIEDWRRRFDEGFQ